MKKLLLVLFALMAASLVIGVATVMIRSGEAEPEATDEATTA
jgi:hypothetical protein